MKDKPFALIGVNFLAREPGDLNAVMEKENITWRTFDDNGPISRQWNFPTTPAIYILDHNRMIRHKWVGKIGAKTIDTSLERLMKKAEGDTASK